MLKVAGTCIFRREVKRRRKKTWRARMRAEGGGRRKKEEGAGGGEGEEGGLVSLFRGGRRIGREKEKEKVLLVNREQLLYVFQRKY